LEKDFNPITDQTINPELEFYKEKLKQLCQQFKVKMPVYKPIQP
jgi:hypothetical protein